MNKYVKKFLLMCMTVLLVFGLAACRKETTGRYVEKEVTPETEEEIKAVFKDGDSLIAYTKGLTSVYTSTDKGNSWEKEDGPGKESVEAGEADCITRLTDGTVIFAVTDNPGEPVMKITPEGKIEELPISDYDAARAVGEEVRIQQLTAIGDDQLLVYYDAVEYIETEEYEYQEESFFTEDNSVYEEKVVVCDAETGNTVKQLDAYNGSGSVVYGDESVYVMNSTENVFGYKADSWDLASELPSIVYDEGSTGLPQIALVSEEEAMLYAVNSKHVWQITPEKGQTEEIVDSSGFRFGNPEANVKQLIIFEEQDFMIQIQSDADTRLYRYTYDEESEVDPEKKLHVWTLEENSTVRAAVREYMSLYPDAVVELEVAMETSSSMTSSDALRDLNTRMLAGEGPDIIMLDGCPIDTYIDNELLLDLNDKIDLEDVFEPVYATYKQEEGTYYFPARFAMPIIAKRDSSPIELNSYEDFVDMVENEQEGLRVPDDLSESLPVEERITVTFMHQEELFEVLWKSSLPELLNDGEINKDNLKYLLESFKTVFQSKYSGSSGFIQGVTVGSYQINLDESINRFLAKEAHYGVTMAEDLITVAVLGDNEADYIPFTGMAEGSWVPSSFVGVNAKASSEKYAVEFVQMMFDEGGQSVITGGIPVTLSGYEKQMETMGDAEQITSAEIDLEELLSNMKTPAENNIEIYDMVYAAAKDYLYNSLELDEAVSQIEEGINKYYSEK